MYIPTKKISYDIGNAKLIEYYCDTCLNDSKQVSEGRHKVDIDMMKVEPVNTIL